MAGITTIDRALRLRGKHWISHPTGSSFPQRAPGSLIEAQPLRSPMPPVAGRALSGSSPCPSIGFHDHRRTRLGKACSKNAEVPRNGPEIDVDPGRSVTFASSIWVGIVCLQMSGVDYRRALTRDLR